MQAARRLYLYAMTGITLGVIAVGLVTLLDVVITGTGILEHPYSSGSSRQQLSQAIAMLGVGVPVWAVHWWLVQRGLADGRPERDAERGSPIRAAFVTIVLLVTLLIWVNAASTLVLGLVVTQIPALQDYTFVDPVSSAAWAVVALVIWLYHGVVRRGDLRAGPVSGASAWIPRLYLYGVAFGALMAALAALGTVVNYAIVGNPTGDAYVGESVYFLSQAIQSGVAVLAWGLVWFGHWRYAERIVRSDGWRGEAERESRTRVAAFVATIMATSAMSLVFLALAVHELVSPRIVERPEGVAPIRLIAASFLIAIPWLAAWWAHVRGLRREPLASDPLRALHGERLVSHGVAAVALAIGASGLGWLAGLAIDAALGGGRTAGGLRGIWTTEFSFWLPAAVLGLLVWAWHWRRVLARRRSDPVGEANSTIRRAFMYLTVAGALIVALATAALILYRIVNTVLGEALGGNAVSELSTPLGILLAAVIVLAYHGLQLRADQARKPADLAASDSILPATPATPGTAVAPAPPPAPAVAIAAAAAPSDPAATLSERRVFELVGPEGADLEAALAAARSALPPGIEIVPRGA